MNGEWGIRNVERHVNRPSIPHSALRIPHLLWLLSSCGPGVPFGKVQFGAIETRGVVDEDYLKAQLVPLEPRFEACYAQALRRNHSSEGVVRLSLTGGRGRLVPKVVDNSTKDEGLTGCVTQAIAGLPIVERGGAGPWDFSADWSVEFAIARLKTSGS